MTGRPGAANDPILGVGASVGADQLRDLRELLDALVRQLVGTAGSPSIGRNIATLGMALEELEVALEELNRQNAQLQAAQDDMYFERQRLLDLFQHAPQPYLVTDTHGIVQQANAATARLLAVDQQQLPGRWLGVFLSRRERPGFSAFLRTLAPEPATTEFVVLPRDHAPVVVAAVVVPHHDGGLHAAELRWMLRDITDARRAQAALQEAFARSRDEADELRDRDRWKDAFLAAAAHDLRSHIDAIVIDARNMEPEPGPPHSERQPSGHRILTHASLLRRLLDDLLDLDRFTRGTMTAERRPTVLQDLVEEVVELLPDDAGHEVDVDVPHLVADLDPDRTAQIIDNLLRNALRHTPADTPVRLVVRQVQDGIELVVEDEGPGVPARLREDVFRPFVTRRTHADSALGTGVGLSLVRLFAELHGGSARVDASTHGGARFVVHLPARVGD